MSSAANAAPATTGAATPPSRAIPWASISWFAVLLVVCYAPVLTGLVRQWNDDADMGHGFFVPPIAAYIAWQRRGELLAVPHRTNWLGLLVVIYAGFQLLVATLGAELFLARTALVFAIIGSVLFLRGMRALRILAFPLFLLFFMVPIPAVIYNAITFPLQIFASEVAEFVLNAIGIPVFREGNVLELPSQKLSVVEACSGIRSLLSLTFLGLVYAYFFDSKPWMRIALLIATVPIAIAANAGRVTITGIMSEINPELASGFAHSASGWVIFMIALVILVFVHKAINLGWKLVSRNASA